MIPAWGDRQDGTWEAAATEEDFLSDVVYQFSYTLPEKPWWAWWLFWLVWPKDPEILRDGIVKSIAAKAGIPEEEIQVLWFFYNEADNTFQIQIKWVPAEASATPAGIITGITIIVVAAAIATPLSLFFLGKIIEKLSPDVILKLVEETPEVIKKVVEELRKSISWATVLAGIAITGSVISLLIPRRKKT